MYQVDLVLIRLPLNCIDWVGMRGQMSWSAGSTRKKLLTSPDDCRISALKLK